MVLSVLPKNSQLGAGNTAYLGRARPSSGGGGGGGTPSAWSAPAPGYFSDVSLNTLVQVAPSGWPTADVAGPFINWASGFYANGKFHLIGSGHLASEGAPLWSGVWVWDIVTRQWSGRNIPPAPVNDYGPAAWLSHYNAYGESTEIATLGHTTTPHTYDGVAYLAPEFGGGANGSLIQIGYPGRGDTYNAVHKYDLSASNPATRVVDALTLNNSLKGGYPMVEFIPDLGNKFVVASNNGTGFYLMDPSNWAVTPLSNVGYNDYADHSLIYCPGANPYLVGMGRSGNGGVNFAVWVCPIVGGVLQGFTKVTTTGTPPADNRCGGVWSTILHCIVSYEGSRSLKVHRLTAPTSGGLTAGTWTWTSETLVGDQGQLPSNPGINTNSASPYEENGAWSRFVECPEKSCFLWCNGLTGPMQAWRLQGM